MTKSVEGKPTGEVMPDFSDEIIDAATVTFNGERHVSTAMKENANKNGAAK